MSQEAILLVYLLICSNTKLTLL